MLSTVCLMFTGRPWGQVFLNAFTQRTEHVAGAATPKRGCLLYPGAQSAYWDTSWNAEES